MSDQVIEPHVRGLDSPRPLPCVLACSGCSHAGELADHTARRLQELGVARMSCLAGVGGHIKSILTTIQSAPTILMIDGCPLECGGNGLKRAGFSGFSHLKLHELGVRKHDSVVGEGTVQALAEAATIMLTAARVQQATENPDKICQALDKKHGARMVPHS